MIENCKLMPHRYGVIKKNQKSCEAFLKFCPDFHLHEDLLASDYIEHLYNEYKGADIESTNSLNGAIFELIIYTVLIRAKIVPFYIQSSVAFVPNVRYDILLNSKEYGPIGLSLKTSLRERYKQADLESYVLKNVHRNSKSFIITADAKEADNVNLKIENGDLLALNRVYHYSEVNELIDFLKNLTLVEPVNIPIITGKEVKEVL